ncbi:MAG TPA: hypothetical protein PLI77_05615 [Bacteroidales bacterium]|nr:hypothetical protein [Bacteroidales bacterium]
MKKGYILFLITILVLISSSCDDTDLTPAYLIITKEDLQNCINTSTFNDDQDEAYGEIDLEAIRSHHFKDVWVYLNGKNLGCWELPCKIPILPNYSDSNFVQLVPGIRLNGVSTMIPVYPFLTPFNTTYYMDRENSYQLSDRNVNFKYAPAVKFPLLETFEQSTEFASIDSDGVNIQIVSHDNRTVGQISLQDTVTFFDVKSPKYTLKGSGNFTLWEMDYKCDNDVFIELFVHNISGTITPVSLVTIKATNGEWKKIYINLTSTLTQFTSSASTIGVELVMNGNRLGNNAVTNFYFDNIKLITFE